jgi:hypothetical protein
LSFFFVWASSRFVDGITPGLSLETKQLPIERCHFYGQFIQSLLCQLALLVFRRCRDQVSFVVDAADWLTTLL